MCFGFQRNNALNGLYTEPVAGALVVGCKLFHRRPLCKGHVVLIGRENFPWVFLRGFLNESKEARFAFLSVYNKGATENLMPTVFRIDLSEAENL